MTRLNVTDTRCAALFASGLQQSDVTTEDAIAQAVRRTVRRFGVLGCEGRMAQEFGDHPEAAIDRMRWVRQLVREMPTGSSGLARPGLARPGLARPGLARPGLARPGSQRAA